MKFKSIATRIVLSVVPIIAFFTFLYIAVIYKTMSGQADSQFDERLLESLRSAKLNVSMELMMNENIAEGLAIYAESCSSKSIENGELKEFLLKAIPLKKHTVGGGIWFEPYSLYKNERYFGPYVFVDNGKAVYAPEYSSQVDYHNAEWYINGKNSRGEITWSDVYYDPVAKVTMITATKPFFDKEGNFRGVATADMALTNIKAISSSISVGKTGQAFILGANGEFISFINDSRNINMRITSDANQELAALGKHVLATNNGSASLTWNGQQHRAFFSKIEPINWHLIVMIDTAEVDQSANSTALSLAILPIIGLVLVTICIIFVANSLKQVANKVNRFADKAASGDLSERINISEHNEFGVMEDRLNRMMDTMAEMRERSAKMLEMAQTANKAKTEFLSKMSHEMRTPMNAIIGMVQIAQRTDDNKKIQDCLGKIALASNSLLELINDVLDMSKIEANKIELEVVRFSIHDTFKNLAKIFTDVASEKSLKLTMLADESIPGHIWGDKLRYSQVMINLIGNAIKFTPEGGEILVTAIPQKEYGNTIIIKTAVRDTGIGITPEFAERLFISFEQADSSISRKYGGTGLGLSISKNLVELMGGKIWAEQNEGPGSNFIFTITASKSGALNEPDLPDKTRPQASYNFSGKHILLVEDVEINCEIITELLKDTLISIDCAENGKVACEIFAANPDKYDLIFMDIQMPVMDGLTATRELRRMEPELRQRRLPIVGMSANAFKEDMDASLEAGMDGHLSKPIDLPILLNTLDQMLNQ